MFLTTLWVHWLGCQVRYSGTKYMTRIAEAGQGEPLLLLHGNGGHVENFSKNLMVYAHHFRTIAMDFVWHGYSQTAGFDPALVPTFVDQVLDLMDAEGIKSANVEGQSMGGWPAMTLALRHPERVRKLVLTTTQGFRLAPGSVPGLEEQDRSDLRSRSLGVLEDPSWENVRIRLERLVWNKQLITDELVAIRHKIYNRPETNAVQRRVVSAYMGGAEAQAHVLDERMLADIRQPTLVYWGEKNSAPPPVGQRLAHLIPHASYYCAPETGHWAQFEHADEHNREVLRFLTGDATLVPQSVEDVSDAPVSAGV